MGGKPSTTKSVVKHTDENADASQKTDTIEQKQQTEPEVRNTDGGCTRIHAHTCTHTHMHLIKFTHPHTNFAVCHYKASPTLEEMKADFKPMSAEEKDTDAIWCGELLDLFSPDDKNPVCAQQVNSSTM